MTGSDPRFLSGYPPLPDFAAQANVTEELCKTVAAVGLTKTLAREACFQLARSDKLTEGRVGVTVNTVAPGYVATDMAGALPEKVMNRIKGTIPLGRLARPEEIARVVHFLAADASGYITGQVWG